ncbi:hypothetical protein WJX79_002828 [Trebouxia sp. C0005]
MADLGIARQTTAFYRSSTGARRQTARWITHTHLARRQHNSQAARASRDPECTPSPFQSAASPAAQDIGRKEHLSEPSAVSQQTVQQSAHSHRPLPAAALFAALRVTHAFRIIAHPSITLDKKWADMQEQLAGNKDVSDRLQTLFTSRMTNIESEVAVSVQQPTSTPVP